MKREIETLRELKKMRDIGVDKAIEFASKNIPEFASHMETWGSHCGAPKSVYGGHLIVLILASVGLMDIGRTVKPHRSGGQKY